MTMDGRRSDSHSLQIRRDLERAYRDVYTPEALAALAALAPQAASPSQPTAPPTTTVTFSATVLGAGYHGDDCDLAFLPTFTTRGGGRADLSLSFTPLAGQQLALHAKAPDRGVPVRTAEGNCYRSVGGLLR